MADEACPIGSVFSVPLSDQPPSEYGIGLLGARSTEYFNLDRARLEMIERRILRIEAAFRLNNIDIDALELPT